MDHLTQRKRSENMSRIRSTDTAPEIIVRQALKKLRYKVRTHVKNLVGNPDIVIPRRKTVIFINGCFWHQHKGCSRANVPKTNKGYWLPKLRRNLERDKEVKSQLQKDGWRVKVVWECQTKNPVRLKRLIKMYCNKHNINM